MLKIVNLVKKFNDAIALDNINIDIKKGDRINNQPEWMWKINIT
jgi:ABC-type sugar transport system ATPase subunit